MKWKAARPVSIIVNANSTNKTDPLIHGISALGNARAPRWALLEECLVLLIRAWGFERAIAVIDWGADLDGRERAVLHGQQRVLLELSFTLVLKERLILRTGHVVRDKVAGTAIMIASKILVIKIWQIDWRLKNIPMLPERWRFAHKNSLGRVESPY